jgi:parvulin-like peptidyl-prolyl isomerase
MKHLVRLIAALALAGLFVIALSWSASDITKSTNYKSYELKYLVNLTDIGTEESDATLNNLKNTLETRLHKFEVAQVLIEKETKDNNNYLNLKFGSIDDIKAIKLALELNETFVLKEKVAAPVDEKVAEEENTPEEETATELAEKVEPYKTEIENTANETLQRILTTGNYEIEAQNSVLKDPLRRIYSQTDWMYKDEIKDVFAEKIFGLKSGEIYPELIKYQERPFALAAPIDIVTILKVFNIEEVDRTSSTPKTVDASHILIAYKEAMRASETTTRSKEEAKSLADEIKSRLNNGEDFSTLAKEYSDDTTNKNDGGHLTTPAGNNMYVEQFENASLALENEGQISEVVESPFGFHIIKAGVITPATDETHKEPRVRFGVLFYAMQPAEWQDTELTHKFISNVETIYTQEYDPYILVKLNDEGKNLLKNITERNNNNILGIFAGKELITSFTVQEVNVDGVIKILRPSTTKEADELKAKLTQEPLPAPIILIEEKLPGTDD